MRPPIFPSRLLLRFIVTRIFGASFWSCFTADDPSLIVCHIDVAIKLISHIRQKFSVDTIDIPRVIGLISPFFITQLCRNIRGING